MARNTFMISLDVLQGEQELCYYSARNEYGWDYCEAILDMEAITRLVLARYPIDEILVIGGEEARSAFELYQSRIGEFIRETSEAGKACETLLPEAEQGKIIDFIHDFHEKHSARENKRFNRFFDELAGNRSLYNQFIDALFTAFPEAGRDSRRMMGWVQHYLYTQLKDSAKLEALQINENVEIFYISSEMLGEREYWMNEVLKLGPDASGGKDRGVNLYIALPNEAMAESHIILNTIHILMSTPGSGVYLKKIYQVSDAAGNLTGKIKDGTVATYSTDLVAAAHAFLNYSKTDQLVEFWEKSGEQSKRIGSMIYAARHVDVGISMCNIGEIREGIQQLIRLFRDEHSWAELGNYGLLFGIIAGCIRSDYGPLLENDGNFPLIELIKWAYRHQQYQQVLTLIETFAPADMVKSGIFYYCDDEEKAPEVTKLLALQRLELKPYELYKMDDISHYYIKYYDQGSVRLKGSREENREMVLAGVKANSIRNQDPNKISGHTACDSVDTLQDLLFAYYNLSKVRNKVSHADQEAMAERRLNVDESDISFAMVMLRESIEFYIASYEKAAAEVKGKHPKVIAIHPDDVRLAAERLKREDPRSSRPPFDRNHRSPRFGDAPRNAEKKRDREER